MFIKIVCQYVIYIHMYILCNLQTLTVAIRHMLPSYLLISVSCQANEKYLSAAAKYTVQPALEDTSILGHLGTVQPALEDTSIYRHLASV